MKNIIDITDCLFELDDSFLKKRLMVTINSDIYYIKSFNWNELIVYEFCRLLDISCVSYKIAKNKDELCLISKSFRKKDCKYIRGFDLIDDFLAKTDESELEQLNMDNLSIWSKNNLETIWLALAHKYHENESKYNDIRKVMVSLLEQYFLMILIQDADFHSSNWEIEETDNHISLAPKFDNESAFSMEVYGVRLGVDINDSFETTLNTLDYFLNVTAREDNELFLELFSKATPTVLQNAIDTVRSKYEIDDPYFEKVLVKYTRHYEQIGEFLKKKGLKK